MSSYNLLNGIHASENKELLTGILRDEWGFDGVAVSYTHLDVYKRQAEATMRMRSSDTYRPRASDY